MNVIVLQVEGNHMKNPKLKPINKKQVIDAKTESLCHIKRGFNE